jgi:ribosomal protein S18 acetylase RimI-like enzyme
MPKLTTRFYEDERDLHQMQALLMEARFLTDDWRYWHVGELIWTFFMVARHLMAQDHVRLWQDAHGKLVAYSLLGEDGLFDWQVHPEYEWSEIEPEALSWAETLNADLRKREPQKWKSGLVCNARQTDDKRNAFLRAYGFQESEHSEINLIRPLAEPIAVPPLPPHWEVRAVAGTGEAAERAAVQAEVWHPWSVGNVDAEGYLWLMSLPGYDRDLDVVAVTTDGTIAAYVNGWADPSNRIGDLGPVGARARFRRLGLTRAVLLQLLRRMQARGMNRACVSTQESNTPALKLYESIGFKPANTTVEFTKAK